ncbi:MAG TPA: O-antigen ligase family protein [Gaiellaceae bacterium]|jgi:O-antigen ligase
MPLALALLLPLVFLHAEYQPSWSVGSATLYLSDVAVLAIGGLGVASGLRHGFGPLRSGRAVWISSAAFLVVVFCSNVYGALRADGYAYTTHFLTAAKLTEYALLALAVPLVLRAASDLERPLATLTAWSCAATAGALLQFLGVLNEFEGRRPGQREPSFLGIHDLAALSGATLSIGLLWLALGQRSRLGPVGAVAGGLGVILSGATAAAAGIVAAGAAAWLLGRRRALAIAAVVGVVVAGVIGIRALDTRPLLDLLHIEHRRAVETNPEASWKQRLALGYIGGRIFLAHPLFGVGWQASEDESSYAPYLDDARAHFPGLPARALPSPLHPWGVQNAYVQAAADMGVVGLAAFLALLLVPLRLTWRAGARSGVPILWLLVTMGVWLGLGLVAGIPLVALTWLSIGLAAAVAAWREPV